MFLQILLGLIASAFAAEVITNNAEVETDGFRYNYEIDDGTVVKATGVNNNHEGSYKWVSPEGESFTVNYVADENGYQPTGAHIPQPNPLIIKAIEYIKANLAAKRR